MIEVLTIFAKNMRRLRKIVDMTQENFAEKLDITPRNLRDIENAKRIPRPEIIDKICENLKISPYELFKTPDDMVDNEKSAIINHIVENLSNMLLEYTKLFNNMITHTFDKE